MGIHYDYKSTRGEKAMKKEAKRKASIEKRRARWTKKSNRRKTYFRDSRWYNRYTLCDISVLKSISNKYWKFIVL